MPQIDLSILNQRQTPAFYADVLANRPAAGFIGRIFVSTNTYAFYRDNGTSWDLIGGPGTGTITGSGSNGSLALWNGTDSITYDVALLWDGTTNALTADKFIVAGGTSSQFLKGNGTLDSNTYNTGSGAVNQVAYWNGTNAITGDNELYYDSTNNYLGVGTNAPGAAIDAHSAVNVIQQLNQTVATNNSLLAFQNAGAGLWRIGNFYNTGANDFGVYDVVGAIQPVTIKKTTGQVLIGPATVGSGKLVVSSNSGDNGIQIVGASAPSLRIDNAGTGPTLRIGLGISTATNNFIQGSASGNMCVFNGSTTASPMLFGIYDAGAGNVQEAARISAARNFLIGTTTDAGYKLDVNGSGRFNATVIIDRSGSSLDINPTTGQPNITLRSGNTFRGYIEGNSSGGLSFGAGASATIYQTITSAGNVGIGTTTPARILSVYGGSIGLTNSTTGQSSIDGVTIELNGTAGYFWNYENDALIFGTNNTERARYSNAGNLLIGTTTDNGRKLQVNGSIWNNNFYAVANNGYREYLFQNASSIGRWSIFSYGADETGGNVGGDLYITRYDDSGTYLGQVLRIYRSSGYIVPTLPTSSAGLPSGALWNNLGIVSVAP
jgi:hypothetical protein